MDKVKQEDYKYYIDNPNYNFKRTQAIIQETIQSTKKLWQEMGKVSSDGMNRIDMVGSYGIYRFNKGFKNFRQYIGEKRYKELVGEKITEKLKVLDTIRKLQGDTKVKEHYFK